MSSIKKIFPALFALALAIPALALSSLADAPDYIPALPVWDGTVAESYAGGNGTKENPFLISDGAQLALLMKEINDTEIEAQQTTAQKYYTLTNDIVLNDITDFHLWSDEFSPKNQWTPGGYITSKYVMKGFAGYFDGGNYDIYGLYINSTESYNGLFGIVYNGQIKNVGIKYAYIIGGNETAALAGKSRAAKRAVYYSGCKVENTTVKGKIYVGGVLGYTEAFCYKTVIDKCSFDGSVSGDNYVGGISALAGGYGIKYDNDDNYAISVTNCINNAQVSGNKGVGGIIGTSKDFISSGDIALLIENCINNGAISSTTEHMGAIVGTAGPESREDPNVIIDIKNCYGNQKYSSGIYGYTLAATDASTSALYTDARMKDKSSFAGFDLETVWIMVTDAPALSLRIWGDATGDGKLSAKDFIDILSVFTGKKNIADFQLANTDFNKDGKFDMSDLNRFADYLKNKGAKGA